MIRIKFSVRLMRLPSIMRILHLIGIGIGTFHYLFELHFFHVRLALRKPQWYHPIAPFAQMQSLPPCTHQEGTDAALPEKQKKKDKGNATLRTPCFFLCFVSPAQLALASIQYAIVLLRVTILWPVVGPPVAQFALGPAKVE